MTKLKRPVRVRWSNHHDKNFKPGDDELTFELPADLECRDVEHRRIESRLSTMDHLDIVYFTYINPLSGVKSGAIVPKSYVTTE